MFTNGSAKMSYCFNFQGVNFHKWSTSSKFTEFTYLEKTNYTVSYSHESLIKASVTQQSCIRTKCWWLYLSKGRQTNWHTCSSFEQRKRRHCLFPSQCLECFGRELGWGNCYTIFWQLRSLEFTLLHLWLAMISVFMVHKHVYSLIYWFLIFTCSIITYFIVVSLEILLSFKVLLHRINICT